MARTQAVYYRDKNSVEPVDEFIETLPAKRAAKIDAYVEEHLNGRPPGAPPPEFPVTSQIDGELRPHPDDPVLKRVLAVLDEELLIGIERRIADEEPERELAPAPEVVSA